MFDHLHNQALDRQLVDHEGRKDRLYIDTTGHATIGVGHNLSVKPVKDHIIAEWFEEDKAEAIHDLITAFPWVVALDPVRQRVLVDMTFNLGIGGLKAFAPTLALVQAGDYAGAAARLRKTLWFRQTKRRAKALIDMLETGRDPFSG